MSDHDFENYLSLLSGLLRLSRRQRGEIAAELRAHLDDRLEELTASGVSRDEAVRQALAEFGDAAGLAGQFTTISTERKRRWLMRLTTYSVAATILIAAAIATFWPGRNAAPGRADAIAQNPGDADPFAPGTPAEQAARRQPAAADPFGAPPAAGAAAQSGAPAAKPSKEQLTPEKVIDAALNRTTSLDVVEMPLRDVVQYLQEANQIPIVLKGKKLDEVGVPLDTPITKSLKGVRFATVLEILLDDLDLTYYTGEVLFITTPADAAARAEIRVYDCRDLLAMPAPARAAPQGVGNVPLQPMPGSGGGTAHTSDHDQRASQLMSIITTNIDPQTWLNTAYSAAMPGGGMGAMAGGAAAAPPDDARPLPSGSISEYNGLSVVTQTAPTHKKIERVLDMLREAAGLDAAKRGKVVQ
jgi:hypothetical protein